MLPDMVESGKPTTSEGQPQEQPKGEGEEGSKEETKKEDAGASEQEETGDLSPKLKKLELSIKENQEERRGLAKHNESLLKGKNEEQRKIILGEFLREEERLEKEGERLKKEQRELEKRIAGEKKPEEKASVEENGTMAERFSRQRLAVRDRFIDIYYGELTPSRDPKAARGAILQHIEKEMEGQHFFTSTNKEKRKYGGSGFTEKALQDVINGWIRSTVEETIKILQDLGKVDR